MALGRWKFRNPTRLARARFPVGIALAGLLFGLIGFGEVAEDVLRVGRNNLHQRSASGDIVLVRIDEDSLTQVGTWPWPRRQMAQIVDELTRQGARRIFLNLDVSNRSNPVDDRLFEQALARSGRVTLPVRLRQGFATGAAVDFRPLPQFARHTAEATISVAYNYQGAVLSLPYSQSSANGPIPSFSAQAAGVKGKPDRLFQIDYSIDPQSIPVISAADVLHGRAGDGRLRGKDVVVGTTAAQTGELYFIPGHGRMGAVYTLIIGAETLKTGIPVSLGWYIPYLLGVAAIVLAAMQRRPRRQDLVLALAAAILLLNPLLLERHLIFVDTMPGLFVVVASAAWQMWKRLGSRGETNAISGLPNLHAMRKQQGGQARPLVAARVRNFTEIVAALEPECERQLVEQIVGRLSVGAPERTVFQGDEGVFTWFMDSGDPIGHHLDALYALFRNPARVGDRQFDLAVTFGVEIGSRSADNRLASALIAADEAASEGAKWKNFDHQRLTDAPWRLSLLGMLDQAIDHGQIWIAYQPKLDLASGRLCGAEALARWTHPEKGPISPIDFIPQAEQNDRIEKLTYFVLEQAIAAAANINAEGVDFGIAVNLSARLTGNSGLLERIRQMLAEYRLPPSKLTLELTETATLRSIGNLASLGELRNAGIRISIDDYGTGQSTLNYLKQVPASELKIDQSFVRAICDNRSDRLMVQSTIALAHELGRIVVAEGVEDKQVLDLLREMNCDVAQGFAVGRPTSLDALLKRLLIEKGRAVA